MEDQNKFKKEIKTVTSRKIFLKQAALSIASLSAFAALGRDFDRGNAELLKDGHPINNYKNKLLRTIQFNVFNGGVGYKKGIKRGLSEEASYLIRKVQEMNQITDRIVLQLELYQPNIISFSEAPTKENTVVEMAKRINMNYAYFAGDENGESKWPGCILTNYELFSSENRPFINKDSKSTKGLFTRHWGKAKLRLDDGSFLTVHSVHLYPTTEEGAREIRLAEIEELLKSINYDLDHGSKSVLLQGDLNYIPETPEYERLKEGGLIDMFAQKGSGKGYTARPTYYPDSTESEELSRRIDYIMAKGSIADKIVHCRTLYEGSFRLNNDDPKSFCLSDHIPVLADFEI